MSWGLGKVKTVLLDSRPLSEKRWSYLLAFNSVDIGKCVDLGYYNGRKVTYFPGCYCWPMENRQWKSHICIWVIHVCFLPGKMKCPVFKILKLRPYVFTWSAWQCMYAWATACRWQTTCERQLPLSTMWVLGLNSHPQAWWQVSLPNEPSC